MKAFDLRRQSPCAPDHSCPFCGGTTIKAASEKVNESNILALRRVRRDVEPEPHADGTRPLETIVGPPMNAVWLVGCAGAILR